jgi:hypothetical protein
MIFELRVIEDKEGEPKKGKDQKSDTENPQGFTEG